MQCIDKRWFIDESYTAYMKAVKSKKVKIWIVKVNQAAQESFDKWHEKTCGRIKDRYYKRSLAHKRETKGVKHETWTRLQAEKASGAYGTRKEDEPDI